VRLLGAVCGAGLSLVVVALAASAAWPAVRPTAAATSPIRVTLTAENHRPHPTESPSWQWWYCVKVTTAAGKSVASEIQLQILSGRTRVEWVGLVSLRKGYDRWCAAIGGEGNVLDALPRGKKLVFRAVVRADGVTVARNWPIVVPVGHIYSVRAVEAAFASQGIALKRVRPRPWPSDAAALRARHEVFVEIVLREPAVWGGPGSGHVSSEVSAHSRFAARANIEVWSSPAVETAVKRALARLEGP